MRRRQFITLLGGAAAAWPLGARAQQRVHVVGILASQPLPPIERFVRKLREYGYVEGQNLRLVRRFSEGYDDRFPAMAVELTALPVDMIVTWGTPAAVAAKQATRSIPVVMGAIGDPVSVGIVSNLARPGGNITGFAAQNVDLEGKRLELLRDLLPQLSRVAMLANAANPLVDASMQNLRTTAEQLRINFDIFGVRSSGEIEAALQRLNNARPDGVLIASDLLLLTRRSEIAEFLATNRLPAVYPFREYAGVGGLMIHGANLGSLFERAAGYVDRILKGAKPADLPVQLATEFELIINLKTAAAMGLTVPPTLLARADEVIETAPVHHPARRRGGVAALGARAAVGAYAAHRRAVAVCRRRCGNANPHGGVLAGAGAVGLDHRPQLAHRHPLGRVRSGAHA
jgi:putative tryptophan/tyrosine transport system substrate-binding protein